MNDQTNFANIQMSNQVFNSFKRKYSTYLNSFVAYPCSRWISLVILTVLSIIRAYQNNFMAIIYFQGLYILYLILQYYTPVGLPDPDEDEFSLELQLPDIHHSQGDRPILRSINEFTLWKSITGSMSLCYICTYFDIFNIPVYWPFLVGYFIFLVIVAIRKHTRHMKKYGYGFGDFNQKKIVI